MAPAHPAGRLRPAHRHRHDGDHADQPAGLAPDRLLGAAQQGDRRRATRSRTSPASTRTACSRSARPTRSWTRRPSAWRPTTLVLGKHSGAPRAPAGAGATWASRSTGRCSTRPSSASRSSPTTRSRSRPWTSRRWSPTRCARTSSAFTFEWFDVEASSRRPPHATVGVRRPTGESGTAPSPATARWTRSSAPSTPPPAWRPSCASSASTPSPEGQDALGEVSVVVELGRPSGVRAGRLHGHHRGVRARVRARALQRAAPRVRSRRASSRPRPRHDPGACRGARRRTIVASGDPSRRRPLRLAAGLAATVCEAFQLTVASRPDEVALRTRGDAVSITWREYAERVAAVAAGLVGARRRPRRPSP